MKAPTPTRRDQMMTSVTSRVEYARTGALLTLTFHVIIKVIECREKRFELTTLVHRDTHVRMIQRYNCGIWVDRTNATR